jgi:hypothetical protein
LADTFTITSVDGTRQTVTVAIHGAIDFDDLATVQTLAIETTRAAVPSADGLSMIVQLKSSNGDPKHSLSSEAEQHNASQGASGSRPANSQELGDSFQFRDDASQGSLHGAVSDHLSDFVGHHAHAEGLAPAFMPEATPPDVDPAYAAIPVHSHVLHDLIV